MRTQLAILALIALNAPAAAAETMPTIDDFYVQGFGGIRVPDNLKFDGTAEDLGLGTTFGLGAGVDTSIAGVSVDLDYMRTTDNYSGLGTALDTQSLMVDGQYTVDLNMGIKPYVAAGIGGVNVTYKSSDSGNAFGYQFKLGASGPITDQLSWFGEYRYQQAFGDVSIGAPAYPVEYASHSILGGVKLSFGGGTSGGSFPATSY